MKFIIAVLICGLSISGWAQMDNQKLQYLQKIEKFRRMRTLGLAMTVLGTGLAIGGFSRIVKANYTYNSNGQYVSSDPEAGLLFLAGAPIFSGGITLTIIGHKKMKKYVRKLNGTFDLGFIPQQPGLALTYKF